MEEEEKGFQIRDRRAHLQETDRGKTSGKSDDPKPTPSPKKDAPAAAGQTRPSEEPPESAIPVNFSSFILSLATSALIHLGQEANPATGERSVELPSARQVIDLIALLEEKTKGNLTSEEEGLLTQILFTLRMKFVEVEKKRHP